MTDISDAASKPGLRDRIAGIRYTIRKGAETARRLEELEALSDNDLTCRGTTRDQAIREIQNDHF